MRALILGGLGDSSRRRRRPAARHRRRDGGAFADALSDPMQRMFRAFADQNRSDLRALAACIRGSRQTLSAAEVGRDRRADAGGGWNRRRGCGRRAAHWRAFPARRRARHPRPRSQSRRRRQGLQRRRAGVPGRAALSAARPIPCARRPTASPIPTPRRDGAAVGNRTARSADRPRRAPAVAASAPPSSADKPRWRRPC